MEGRLTVAIRTRNLLFRTQPRHARPRERVAEMYALYAEQLSRGRVPREPVTKSGAEKRKFR